MCGIQQIEAISNGDLLAAASLQILMRELDQPFLGGRNDRLGPCRGSRCGVGAQHLQIRTATCRKNASFKDCASAGDFREAFQPMINKSKEKNREMRVQSASASKCMTVCMQLGQAVQSAVQGQDSISTAPCTIFYTLHMRVLHFVFRSENVTDLRWQGVSEACEALEAGLER